MSSSQGEKARNFWQPASSPSAKLPHHVGFVDQSHLPSFKRVSVYLLTLLSRRRQRLCSKVTLPSDPVLSCIDSPAGHLHSTFHTLARGGIQRRIRTQKAERKRDACRAKASFFRSSVQPAPVFRLVEWADEKILPVPVVLSPVIYQRTAPSSKTITMLQ